MSPRSRLPSLSGALVLVGIVLLVGPALLPVQPMLYHDTRLGQPGNASELRERGFEVVPYENLSERGQALYVATLEHGGEYAVPQGQGASDFAYPKPSDRRVERPRGRVDVEDRYRGIAIERPADDAGLPPADEPVRLARRERPPGERGGENASVEQRRREIARYDLLRTRTDLPPLSATPNVVRLLSVALGAVAIGAGGYRRSRP
ncbi:MAG: hypothetical protein ABEJ31_12185 [Haloarculaceae archaeon]